MFGVKFLSVIMFVLYAKTCGTSGGSIWSPVCVSSLCSCAWGKILLSSCPSLAGETEVYTLIQRLQPFLGSIWQPVWKHIMAFASDIFFWEWGGVGVGVLLGIVPKKSLWVKRILLTLQSRILNVSIKAVWQAVAPSRAGINMPSFIIWIAFFPWASFHA